VFKVFLFFISILILIFANHILNNNRMMQILINNIGSDANTKPPTKAAASLFCGGFFFVL
jgi:hypothetical protein